MKTKFFIAALTFSLATIGLQAEPKVDAIVANAVRDPKNAPLIVAIAAGENSKLIGPITTAAVAALPDQTLEIVGALLEMAPKQHAEILRAAILGQPKLAVAITSTALAMFPNQTTEIMKAAIEAAPEGTKGSVAALGDKVAFFDTPGGQGRAPRVSFPTQPIRADLVSASR